MLSYWLSSAPLALIGLALFFAPGYGLCFAAGLRSSRWLLISPPLSLGIIGAAGIVGSYLSIFWSLGWVSLFTVASWAIALLGRLLLTGTWRGSLENIQQAPTPHTSAPTSTPAHNPTRTPAHNPTRTPAPKPTRTPAPTPTLTPTRTPGLSPLAVFTLLVGLALVVVPVLQRWNPYLPVEQIDTTFHYNAAWTITQTGNASLLTAAGPVLGLVSPPTYYPLIWHSLVALMGGATAIIPAAVMVSHLASLTWMAGLYGLANAILPRHRWAGVGAVAASFLFPAFPTLMLYPRGLWPNALGSVLLPATLCFFVILRRYVQTRAVRVSLVIAVLGLAAVGGMSATYPSTLFGLALIGLPLFISILASGLRLLSRRARVIIGAALALIAIALPVAVEVIRPGTWVSFFGRQSYAGVDNIAGRLFGLVTLWPDRTGYPFMYLANGLALALSVAGVIIALRRAQLRWLVWGWLAALALLAASYFPLGPLTTLTSLWHNDPNRIVPLVIVFNVVFAGVAIGIAATSLTTRLTTSLTTRLSARLTTPRTIYFSAMRTIGAAVGVVVLVAGCAYLSADTRSYIMRPAYAPNADNAVVFADVDQLRATAALRGKLEPGLAVLGDPGVGTAYFQVMAGQNVVFPHFTLHADADFDGLYLANHFRSIHTDPNVCELLRHYGIGYYYDREPGRVAGFELPQRTPGLYGVDTATGFDRVAEVGPGTLWRITACGDIQPRSNPYAFLPPFEPIVDYFGNPILYTPTGERLDGGSVKQCRRVARPNMVQCY